MAAPTINKVLFSKGVRHQIDLHRYGTSVVSDTLTLLNQAEQEMMLLLAKRVITGTPSQARLQALIDELAQINAENYSAAHIQLKGELEALAPVEAKFATDLIATNYVGSGLELSLTQPTAAQLASMVSKEPITVGADGKLLLEEIFQGLAGKKEELITQSIRMGMAEGESIDAMTSRIVGTRAAQYQDGVLQASRRSAEAMVRTAVNSVSNKAIQTTYEENSEVVANWIFLATLDSHTTITCASLSGTVWPVGSGPVPPRHVRCRSFALPQLKTWKELGADIPEFTTTARASQTGPVKADIKFDSWLQGEDTAVQKDILGATRQKLFENGLKLDKFTDDAGRVYNLEGPGGLRERNKALFTHLGI